MKAILHAILTLSLVGLGLCSGFAQPLQDVIRLRLTNTDNGLFDETVIRFHPDATVGYDPNYDAWKLFSIVPAAPSFFSRSPQGWDMTINSYPSLLQDYALDLDQCIQV
ncbi:MAG: hypothetical protein AAGB22_08750, partial [Bacteroidota bacterium]